MTSAELISVFIRPTTYVFSSAAIIVGALVSAVPGLWALRKISLPEVVKERST